MAGITHSTVVVVADDGTSPVGTNEWNADHTITGNVDWGSFKITNLGNPTLAQDAATKNYVDTQGFLSDVTDSALLDGRIWIGNGSNQAKELAVSGDISISNSGVASISSGVIVNADINASANISLSKLATDPLARANHTGTQTKSTISDFPAVVPQAEAEAGTATTERIWTAQRVKQAIAALESGSASITFTDVVNCVMEIPQGTVAFPDVHTLATAGAKKDGFVLPDGASSSTINFSCRVPKDLAATPAMKIRVYIMTLGAVAGPADVRLTVKTTGRADTESLDVALTAESETTVTMPTATETIDIYEQDLTTDWAADDYVIGQISRDPTDAADDFTDDIMIIGIDLLVDRTIS